MKDGVAVIQSTLPLLDFLKVVRMVFWSGVVGPGTNDVELSLARPSRSALVRSRLALTVALRAQKLDLWASLSHCGYPAITDTPRTVAKSPAKTIYRHLTEINSHSYGLSLKRTLTRGPYSVCNKGCWLLIGYNRTPGAWGFFSLGATGSSVVNCSGERRPLTDLWHPGCYNCARNPMETYCQLTVSLLTFI